MSIALKELVKKFMPRDRAYKILKNKAHDVEQDNIKVWKEVFGVITPIVEVKEGRDAYKEEVAKLTEEIKKLVDQCE